MKKIVVLMLLLACFTACNDNEDLTTLHIPKKVPVETLRLEYMENLIHGMKHDKFAGDAEIGVNGNLKYLRELSEKVFPDSLEYFCDDWSGYGNLDLTGFEEHVSVTYRTIYVRKF